MKIVVNIEKKHFFVIMVTIFILAGIFAVNAYRSSGMGGIPSIMGHSVDEIDWGNAINSNMKISGTHTLEFGVNVTGKQVDAGKIGYQTYSTGLDIIGAGTTGSNRMVTVWDTLNVAHLMAGDAHVNDICLNGGRCLSTTGAQGFQVSNAELYTGNCGADAKTTCPHRWCAARGWVSGIVVEWSNDNNYVVCFR